jgi:membrane protein required for colicin V production
MTWVDAVVLLILAGSALFAFLRGFVREALGLCAWVGAVYFAVFYAPAARPEALRLTGNPEFADPAAFAAVFLIALIVFSVIAGLLARLVRSTGLGALDRTIGLLYGLIRGAALVSLAYIAAGLLVAVSQWPGAVLQARSLPLAYAGARWIAQELPPRYAPKVAPPPDAPIREGSLLQSAPHGYAWPSGHGTGDQADDQEVK